MTETFKKLNERELEATATKKRIIPKDSLEKIEAGLKEELRRVQEKLELFK